MHLAQIPPADFAPWLSNLFYLVGLATALVILYQRLRPQKPRDTRLANQPITVRPDIEYVRLASHNELKARVDGLACEIRQGFERLDDKRSNNISALHKELEQVSANIRKDVKSDVEGLHARITDVLAAVAKLEGRLDK